MGCTRLSTLIAVAGFSLAAALGPVGSAHASCVSPPFEVLWTYPENGEQDVPINAQFWALTSSWANPPTVSLNGTELTGISQSFGGTSIDPGRLEPDTDYVLELTYQTFEAGGGVDRVVEIAFRTDSGGIVPFGGAPAVTGHTSQPGFDDHACVDVIGAQDCFDTGQDTLITFDTDDDDAVGWLVQTESGDPGVVWPARCGDPSVYGWGMVALNACYEVRAIGRGGVPSRVTRYCPATGTSSDGGVPEAGDGGVEPAAHDASVPLPQTSDPPSGVGVDASAPAGSDDGMQMASRGDGGDSDPIGSTSTPKGGQDQSNRSSCSVASYAVGSRGRVASVPVLALVLAPALVFLRRRR